MAKPEPKAPIIVLRSDRVRIIMQRHTFESDHETESVLTFPREVLPHPAQPKARALRRAA